MPDNRRIPFMGYYHRTDNSLFVVILLFLFFAIGMWCGNKINDSAHRAAAEQKYKCYQDLAQYRADLDTEAPAHARKAVRNYVRRVRP